VQGWKRRRGLRSSVRLAVWPADLLRIRLKEIIWDVVVRPTSVARLNASSMESVLGAPSIVIDIYEMPVSRVPMSPTESNGPKTAKTLRLHIVEIQAVEGASETPAICDCARIGRPDRDGSSLASRYRVGPASAQECRREQN
jgi:hypothetical protein